MQTIYYLKFSAKIFVLQAKYDILWLPKTVAGHKKIDIELLNEIVNKSALQPHHIIKPQKNLF